MPVKMKLPLLPSLSLIRPQTLSLRRPGREIPPLCLFLFCPSEIYSDRKGESRFSLAAKPFTIATWFIWLHFEVDLIRITGWVWVVHLVFFQLLKQTACSIPSHPAGGANNIVKCPGAGVEWVGKTTIINLDTTLCCAHLKYSLNCFVTKITFKDLNREDTFFRLINTSGVVLSL